MTNSSCSRSSQIADVACLRRPALPLAETAAVTRISSESSSNHLQTHFNFKMKLLQYECEYKFEYLDKLFQFAIISPVAEIKRLASIFWIRKAGIYGPRRKKLLNSEENQEVLAPPDEVSLDLESWLPYIFSMLSNRVSACLFDMYNREYGLSVQGWRILAVLGKHQPLSAKEVSQYTVMDQVNVTRAINQMDALGLITRRVDENDRRRIVLRLSKKGNTARAKILPLALALERAMTSQLSDQERATLDTILKKLMTCSAAEFSNPSDWPMVLKKHGCPRSSD